MLAHESRRSRLIEACPDTIDAMLVTRLVNVRYLSGFTGSNAALLVRPGGAPIFATDGRYLTQAATESADLEVLPARAVAAALVDRAAGDGSRRLGIEASHVTLTGFDGLRQAADGRVELVAMPPIIEPLRAVKDSAELAALRTACEITDAAFVAVITALRSGVTEREIAWALRSEMRANGADDVSFDSIVAFGPNSAIPHHQPTDRPLAPGDLVKVDFGGLAGGYHADMTRTVVLAPAADWQRELHAQVLEIQTACRSACTVGAVPRDLNQRAAEAIESAGHGVAHGLGHGVGLEIHEEPFLTPGSVSGDLALNVALTIEPGIYLPGQGGVRIEDTLVTGADGATSLTATPRELLEI